MKVCLSYFQAEFYPQTITETVFDVLPRVRQSVNGVNFLERLWAYLTIKDLLERVARGELNSCTTSIIKEEEEASTRRKRKVGSIPVDHTDDEDYDEEGSGELGFVLVLAVIRSLLVEVDF